MHEARVKSNQEPSGQAVMDSASRKNLLDVACATCVPTGGLYSRAAQCGAVRRGTRRCVARIHHNSAPQIDRLTDRSIAGSLAGFILRRISI